MPKIILTERAIQKIIETIHHQPNPEQIRGIQISVIVGGCAGLQYKMEFASTKTWFLSDETLEFEGAKPNGEPFKLKVFVSAANGLFLEGTTIDYEETLEGAGFKFDNPNAQEKCACGQSFDTEKKIKI